jgi:NitT/TauT family transport system substrate-binding protein
MMAALPLTGAVPAFAQAPKTLEVIVFPGGFNWPIFVAEDKGLFEKNGIAVKVVPTPNSQFQLKGLIEGKFDIAMTPMDNVIAYSEGQGAAKTEVEPDIFAFLGSDNGFLRLVAVPEVKTIGELKGKQISTTTGTTAHVFLDRALRSAKLDPAKDVQLVNQRMAEAVTSFVSGAVPAVALWVPFNVTVRDKVPGAKKLVDASAYYPQAAIVSGWAASNEFHAKNREVLQRVVRAWSEGNTMLVSKTDEALAILQKDHYKQVPLPDLKEQFGAQKVFSNAEWRKHFADGTVTKWLQQVTDFFVKFGNIQNPTPASQYFDPKIYMDTIKG